jgi:predicted DNA-binding protein
MATTKKRLNISLSAPTEAAVLSLAARDKVPAATKVRELLEFSLELIEDEVLTSMAEDRLLEGKKKRLSHKEVWG